jgi:hypothetical protein
MVETDSVAWGIGIGVSRSDAPLPAKRALSHRPFYFCNRTYSSRGLWFSEGPRQQFPTVREEMAYIMLIEIYCTSHVGRNYAVLSSHAINLNGQENRHTDFLQFTGQLHYGPPT